MSSVASEFYTSDITFWPQGDAYDQFGRPIAVTPYTIKGMWEAKSETKIDDMGNEFVTRNTFHFEMALDNPLLPKKDDKVALGVFTGQPPASAAIIRSIESDDVSLFGADELPDHRVYT